MTQGVLSFESIVIKTLVCVGLKFTLGSDDLVWLAPFMAGVRLSKKIEFGSKYVASVLFLTCLAVSIAEGIHAASPGHNQSSNQPSTADKVVSLVAGGLLFTYSCYLAHDEGWLDSCTRWCSGAADVPPGYSSIDGELEEEEEEEEEDGPIKTAITNGIESLARGMDTAYKTCCPCGVAAEMYKDDVEDTEEDKKKGTKIIVVAFLGSMDDFIVYLTLAASGVFTWYELAIGVTIGAIILATIVGTLLESSKILADTVSKIPVPLVLAILSFLIILSVFVPFLPA